MKPPGAFEMEVDATRNIARIRYQGKITVVEMKASLRQAEKILPGMAAGFIVLADLSGLDAMDLDCAPDLAKLMDLCKANGVGRVVRVIPDPAKDIGFKILSVIHYRGKVPIVTCDTLAEAEAALK